MANFKKNSIEPMASADSMLPLITTAMAAALAADIAVAVFL